MTQDLRFSVEKSHFEDILEKIGAVVPSKDAMPILKNVKFDVSESRLRATATDLELSLVTMTSKVITERVGTALFPAKKLAEIVKESTSEVVTIDVDSNSATISVGNANWMLKLTDGHSFPILPEIVELQLHKTNREALLNALNSVKGAMCQDITKPNLQMICISKKRMVACDGARFQQAAVDFPLDVQIPARAVGDLIKLLKLSNLEVVEVGSTWNHIVFRIGPDIFVINKLAVEFPDVEQTLLAPALKNSEVLIVDRAELIAAIRQVRINADPNTMSITLNLNFDSLAIKGTDQFGNTSVVRVEAEYPYGEMQVTVNHKYLMDMLSMMPSKKCEFYLGRDAKKYRAPLMLKDTHNGIVGVVQQMRSDISLSAMIRGSMTGQV